MRTRAGTISKLRIQHNVPGTSTDVNVYTVYVNGAATAVTVTLAQNALFLADNVNSVLVPNDAQIVIRADKPQQVSGGTICREIVATVEFA
jgi:hypothetical protein